jgi:threonine/homoserine/homoserine lactone efflux protein
LGNRAVFGHWAQDAPDLSSGADGRRDRPRVVKAFLDRLSGLVLVGLGVRLAFERRP